MRTLARLVCLIAVMGVFSSFARSLEKQPASVYRARRVALGEKLKGGVAVLFAAGEPKMEWLSYRQDEDFYYLTGWNEPGAALVVIGERAAGPINTPRIQMKGHKYEEILFLPTRNLWVEQYTGVKLDAAAPGAAEKAGVDEVRPITELPKVLNDLLAADLRMSGSVWAETDSTQAKSLLEVTAAALGSSEAPQAHDLAWLTAELRLVKDAGEIALLRKASDASIAGQKEMMRAVKPGVTELSVAGKMYAAWLAAGCERPSYPPIVGAGINSTVLHYDAGATVIADGDIVTVDAACEYSMYASDITRSVPANGHFTARQREIYDVVLGAQKAAIDAFVAGKSKVGDRYHTDPDGLDKVAYDYVNTHGKSLDGSPLGKYWIHPLSHMVGVDVHDPSNYPTVLKPGMVFTIEPGVYIPEEKIGVRIECVFLVGADGKLIDLVADLPHTADEVEAFMKGK